MKMGLACDLGGGVGQWGLGAREGKEAVTCEVVNRDVSWVEVGAEEKA